MMMGSRSSRLTRRRSRLKCSRRVQNRQNRCLLIVKSSGSGNNGSPDSFPVTPNNLFVEEAIGAEYGEGFETFRADGLLKVDVDFLNDRLQEGFLKRICYAMKPDETYGLVFSWDNVVVRFNILLHLKTVICVCTSKEFCFC